jgi:hypothetical protein
MLVPASFAFGIQIAAAIFGLVASFSMLMNCFVQAPFGLFDCVLAS